MLPKGLQALEQDPRVAFIDDARDTRDGYWVYLKPGLWNHDLGCHFVHEWTVRDVVAAMAYVEPCDCEQCRGES